jgi:hypothetical protein
VPDSERQQTATTGQGADDSRTDALDVLIDQERQLIAGYEARQAKAEGTAAAAVTAVLAVAALTATAAQTAKNIDRTYAWTVVAVLAVVFVAALVARSLAGLRYVPPFGVTSRSKAYREALNHLRECGPSHLDPTEVRQRTLSLCRQRATDAQQAAESKERWAAVASGALAVAVVLALIVALSLLKT